MCMCIALLPELFLVHFANTYFVAKQDGELPFFWWAFCHTITCRKPIFISLVSARFSLAESYTSSSSRFALRSSGR